MASDVSFEQITQSEWISRVISQIRTPRSKFQNFYGVGIGGTNVTSPGGAQVGWDTYNETRQMARGRARGAGPGTARLNPTGHVSSHVYRSHEKSVLLQERLFRTRPLGQNFGTIDARGQNYLTRQEGSMAQRFKNTREFMVAKMFQGGFDIKLEGEDWIPVSSGSGDIPIDFQIPAGNKLKLNMLGAGDILDISWDTTATALIVSDLLQINEAFENLHGWPLKHVWVNSATLAKFIDNDQLKSIAGTANRVFDQFTNEENGFPDLRVVFTGVPWVTFHVYDAVLEEGTGGIVKTKIIPDDTAIFTTDPDPAWLEWMEGSEIVVENVSDVGQERFGFHGWMERITQPAAWELLGVDNGLPALYVPTTVAFGTIVY